MRNEKVILLPLILIVSVFYLVSPVQAIHSSPTFRVGDSCVPVDEEGFIEYDFESSLASAPSKIRVTFIDIYQLLYNPNLLVVNVCVSKLNTDNNENETLIIDSLEFNNQTCLMYNKTVQYFQYHQSMENLLINGYGGFYIMPNDPVDINIVQGYIESYTSWPSSVEENTITIEVNNDQAILQYNEQGLLIREEIRSGGQLSSLLTISEKTQPSISFGASFLIVLMCATIGLLLIHKKKYR